MSRPARRGKTRTPDDALHSQAKILVEDVALWRILAAERSMPYGWIEDAAVACGVSPATVSMAIGGQNWPAIKDPPPVKSRNRSEARTTTQKRPVCPTCGMRKYLRGNCRDPFHRIDHRTSGNRSRDLAPRPRRAKKTTRR